MIRFTIYHSCSVEIVLMYFYLGCKSVARGGHCVMEEIDLVWFALDRQATCSVCTPLLCSLQIGLMCLSTNIDILSLQLSMFYL